MDVKFVRDTQSALRRNTDPRQQGIMIFDENLSLSFLSKKEVRLNQSWAVGFSILELSKYIMQTLMYDVVKPSFNGKASVLLSDTDSWVLALPSISIDEALQRMSNIMDFSNYPSEHRLYNDSVRNKPGYLKNELPCEEILEVVGVRSKTYAIRTTKSMDSRCKGVKQAAKKNIPFEAFKKCVKEIAQLDVTQYSIQSKKHLNRIIQCNKVAFSSFDDKRHLLCGIHSVPYGSVLIQQSEDIGQCWFCAHPKLLC